MVSLWTYALQVVGTLTLTMGLTHWKVIRLARLAPYSRDTCLSCGAGGVLLDRNGFNLNHWKYDDCFSCCGCSCWFFSIDSIAGPCPVSRVIVGRLGQLDGLPRHTASNDPRDSLPYSRFIKSGKGDKYFHGILAILPQKDRRSTPLM